VLTLDLEPTGSGPLDGDRLAVKDNVVVAGVPTALGSGLPGFLDDRDAEVVARARRAGARVTAKAQCEAFLLGANSFTSRPTPVRNPHDPSRSAGGSSSGSAVLVATGDADLAIGTDSGGSIRIPASHCGVVGFKPTRGRVPFSGIAPHEPFLEHAGPLAATVDRAAALFAVLDGADGLDPRQAWSVDDAPSRPTSRGGRLRVGVLQERLDLADRTCGLSTTGRCPACPTPARDWTPSTGPTSRRPTSCTWPST
jgi:amidase